MARYVEFRVRPVTRFVITRYERDGMAAASRMCGEYESEDLAYDIGYALARQTREDMGEPVGSERVIFPQRPGYPPGNPLAPVMSTSPQ